MPKKNLTLTQAVEGLALHLTGMSESERRMTGSLLSALATDPALSGQIAAMLETMMRNRNAAKPEPAKLYEFKASQ